MKKLLLSLMLSTNLIGGIGTQVEAVEPFENSNMEATEKHTRIEAVALKAYYNNQMYTILIDGQNFDMVTLDNDFENGVMYNLYLNADGTLVSYTKHAQQQKFDTEHLMLDYQLIYDIIDNASMKEVDLLGQWNNLQGNVLHDI